MTREEAVELLAANTVGRFAYVARHGAPDVVPVNYAWSDGAILIRSGPGPKLQAAQRGECVAFEVDELDVDRRTGRSVVVSGRACVVVRHPGEDDPDPWADGPRRHLIRIVPSRVDGRRIG
jgi:nitroimidazol reductase NimA-like FMN-containing flavoprotein (pyridoxamine 5'-phosphate oxidase superfamily)